ncbi:MAG: Na/Pi cotransporter family protein [Christensenellaceae bacterium]|jgi:Na/Pi-cotransporter II-like protein
MDVFYAVIKILAGCGAFLLGFKLLSDNMEKIAGNRLKALFNKTSEKKLVGVGMGAVTTAVVQSSSITTVMVVGFVNAGIMTLNQATAVIMGANIGTTITAQIVALQSFDVETLFMSLIFIGVFMEMFSKSDKIKSCGLAFAGLGLVFMGLSVMSDTMKVYTDANPSIHAMLEKVTNPFLLLGIGIGLTALVQSSSAVTTIVITMAAQGLIIGGGGNSALYIILGSNIGTCVTALISSVGANANARRASLIHLMFNVFGAVIFMILLLCWPTFQQNTFEKWFPYPSTQLAMFHTLFNCVCTILFLPFTKVLVKVATILIPDKKKKTEGEATFMDKRFLSTPALAINQLTKETFRMADMAMETLQTAFNGFIERDITAVEKVVSENEEISRLSEQISDYLVQVSASGISLSDEKLVSALHNDVGDIVRIAELADNLTKYTRKEVSDNLVFSAGVGENISSMYDLLRKQYELVKKIALEKDYSLMSESDKLEDDVDNMRRDLIADHIARMSRGECRPENNTVFINLVSNLERIGDHLSYIAHSTDNI